MVRSMAAIDSFEHPRRQSDGIMLHRSGRTDANTLIGRTREVATELTMRCCGAPATLLHESAHVTIRGAATQVC